MGVIKTFYAVAKSSFSVASVATYKFFSTILGHIANFFDKKENVHYSMAYLILIATLCMQFILIFKGSAFPYFIEILTANYGLILALLGLRGYFGYKMQQVNHDKDKSEEGAKTETKTETMVKTRPFTQNS